MFKRVLVVLIGLMVCSSAMATEEDKSVVEMGEVVVTAARTAELPSEVSASVAVVTARDIAERGTTRLDEILQDVVGLHVVSNGVRGSVSTASVRGSESAQVLVMLDGVRLNSPQLGLFDLNQLPVNVKEIERIEVLRGAASALYGSNALGGVINIITRAPEGRSTMVSWTEGERDTRIINGSISQKAEKFSYRLGAEYQLSGGYRENSGFDQYKVNGLFGFSPGGNVNLEFSAYHLDYQSDIPGSITRPSPEAEQGDKRTIASLKLQAPVGPARVVTRIIYERHRNDYTDPGGWSPIDDTHKVDTYGAEVQVELDRNEHLFVFGSDYYSDSIDSTNFGEEGQGRGSLFGQYQVDLLPDLTMLLGLRYDIHSDYKNVLSPRAALKASLTNSTRLRLSASKAFRAPTLNDLYWLDPYASGNPELDSESAREYEMALEQDFGDRARISLAGFLRDIEGLIQWQPTGDPWFDPWTPENVGEARIWGIEVEGAYDLNDKTSMGGNYTYLNPKNRITNDYLLGKAKHEAHGYIVLKPLEGTSLRVDGRYLVYYPESSRQDKNYFVADLALTHGLMIGDVAVDASFTVKNLFDTYYESVPDSPMPPREMFARLTAYF